MRGRTYSKEELLYIEENWGIKSVQTIANNLNRSASGIVNKKERMGLGAFLDCGEYITVHQLFKAIGRTGGNDYTLKHWLKKGFPIKSKKVNTKSFKVVYLNDFWKWSKEYRMHIDFSKFQENAIGEEPSWVKDQRKADTAFAKYKIIPWTQEDDSRLLNLLRLYKYTYKELSMQILRTEGAIKRRCIDLGIIERPLRENPHSKWTREQEYTVMKMYSKGYKSEVIKEYIDKSAQAINGKIERLIRDGMLTKHK